MKENKRELLLEKNAAWHRLNQNLLIKQLVEKSFEAFATSQNMKILLLPLINLMSSGAKVFTQATGRFLPKKLNYYINSIK